MGKLILSYCGNSNLVLPSVLSDRITNGQLYAVTVCTGIEVTSPLYMQINTYITGTNRPNVFYSKKIPFFMYKVCLSNNKVCNKISSEFVVQCVSQILPVFALLHNSTTTCLAAFSMGIKECIIYWFIIFVKQDM